MHTERVKMKKISQKEVWTIDQLVENIVSGCGLRRTELEQLRVCDVYEKKVAGYYETRWVHVAASELNAEREVPYISPYLWAIDAVMEGRASSDLLFPEPLPDLDYDQLRDQYASLLFFGTLEGMDVIRYPLTFHQVGQKVKKALGLKRLDATLQRRLRSAKRDFLRTAEDA